MPHDEQPFGLATEYDAWYDDNETLFQAELKAVRAFLPAHGRGLEVGAGTGRFTAALNIDKGLEPEKAMRVLAKRRGLLLDEGVAESLPYSDKTFDYICFLTSLEFVSDVEKTLQEAHRVLVPTGRLIVAYLNSESSEGRLLAASKDQVIFFKDAQFYTPETLAALLTKASFLLQDSSQVVWDGNQFKVVAGTGDGLYTVFLATRS